MLGVLVATVFVSGLETSPPADRLRAAGVHQVLAQRDDPPAKADDGQNRGGLSWAYEKIFRVEVEATFQEDFHESYDGADTTAGLTSFELQRKRIGVQGALFQRIAFEVERDVAEQDVEAGKRAKSPWKDVNVNLTYFKNAQLQLGKFKVPFGLDALTATTHNDYVYRTLGADYLAPGRDIGAMVHGRFFKRGLSYWAGVFRHDGDNATSSKVQGGDQMVAARLTGTPFRRAKLAAFKHVELGTAFAVSGVSDEGFLPRGLRGRTVVTADTFFQPVYVRGRRYRWEADADWAVGPASWRAEYTRVTDQRLGQGYADQDLPDARYQSAYIGGAYVLRGEKKRKGAVEAVARYERVWFDSLGARDGPLRSPRAETIFPSGERVLTLGVNWTLNRYIKLQLNVMREALSDPDSSPAPNGSRFWSRVLRFQFAL